MSENQDIKKSFKATTLFGGVQVFGIVVSVVRSKIVAVLIGPAGIGLVELYSSTIRLIESFTDFSLGTSAVRDVSVAYNSGDNSRFRHILSVFSRIMWITGLLGLVVCLVGSPLWSKLTFGNYNYTLGFILLSVVLLLNQLKNGKTLLLQSTGNFNYIASSGIIGNILGLITTVPIYYFWGVDGIVAVLILASLFPFLLAFYFTSKLSFTYERVGFNEVLDEGKGMLKQGFLLSINFLLSSLVFYVLRIIISHRGGVAELGLYTAGFAIVNTYIGMILQSMSQEYYPRISALSDNNDDFNKAVNNQMLLSLLLLGPMIVFFLAFSEQLLVILYSDRFISASLFMALSMLGVVFQAPSWCMGYAFLAKGDNKAFLIYETIAKIIKLATDISFYYLWGLTGIGISFIVSFVYYTVQCSLVCKKRYGLTLSTPVIIFMLLYFVMGVIVLLVSLTFSPIVRIVVGVFVAIVVGAASYYKLDKMIHISSYIKLKLKRN